MVLVSTSQPGTVTQNKHLHAVVVRWVFSTLVFLGILPSGNTFLLKHLLEHFLLKHLLEHFLLKHLLESDARMVYSNNWPVPITKKWCQHGIKMNLRYSHYHKNDLRSLSCRHTACKSDVSNNIVVSSGVRGNTTCDPSDSCNCDPSDTCITDLWGINSN